MADERERCRQKGAHRGSGGSDAERGRTPSEGDGRVPGEELDREWLGRYASLEAFALEVVAPLVRSEGRWLLACLDVGRVLRVLAGDDRLTLERGWVVLERVRGEGDR